MHGDPAGCSRWDFGGGLHLQGGSSAGKRCPGVVAAGTVAENTMQVVTEEEVVTQDIVEDVVNHCLHTASIPTHIHIYSHF